MVAWRLTFGVWRRDQCLGVVLGSALGRGVEIGDDFEKMGKSLFSSLIYVLHHVIVYCEVW